MKPQIVVQNYTLNFSMLVCRSGAFISVCLEDSQLQTKNKYFLSTALATQHATRILFAHIFEW